MSSVQPICLITGASAGIGAALAHVCARHGHTLVLAARRNPQLDALAAAITAKGYARPHVVAIDLSMQTMAHISWWKYCTRGLEPAYVINNAGFGLLGEAATLDRERQLAMIDLNVRAVTDLLVTLYSERQETWRWHSQRRVHHCFHSWARHGGLSRYKIIRAVLH